MNIKRLLFTLCLIVTAVGVAQAQNDWHLVAVDGVSYIVYDNTMTAKVVPSSAKNNNYWKFKEAITIPMKIKYNDALYTVTEVGANAFKYWQYAAFYNEDPTCGTISLPATITAIGDNAFEESGLDLIILQSQTPPTLGKNPTIDRRRLMVPSGKKGAYEAAKGWKNAKEITEMVATGGEYEGFYFDYVTDGGETKARIIADPTGNNYESLGDYIEIPDRVYDQKFYPVIAIDDNAFADNKVVKRINASKGVCTIGDKAFANCTQLQTLWFDNNIERIGKEAFLNCSALSTLYLRDKYNLSSIGDRAFYGCSNLKKVETDNPSPFHISKDVFTGATNAVLTVPFGSKSDYEAIPGWAKLRIEEDQFVTVKIGNLYYEIDGRNSTASVEWDQTGNDYSSLTGNVTIPASVTWKGKSYPVTAVGFSAFQDCSSISSVSFPSSVQVIYDYAFKGCGRLKTVKFSEGLKEIKDHAFENCVNLTEMIFPNTLESIGMDALYNCTHLHKMFWPKSLKLINEHAFDGCNAVDTLITDIRSPLDLISYYEDENGKLHFYGSEWFGRRDGSSVLLIPGDCIHEYKAMGARDQSWFEAYSGQIVGIPVKIGDLYYTFRDYIGGMYTTWNSGHPSTKYVHKYEATVVAETNDANNYSSLQGKTVTVPSVVSANGIDWQVSVIGREAFKNAPISSIILPEKLEAVEAEAFLNATRLTSVTIPSQADIGRSAFEGCTALKTVSLSSGMNSLYPSAFARCTALSDIYYMTQSPVSDVDASCFEGVNQAGVTLHVPFGAASSFSSANVWKNFKIEEGNVLVDGIYYSLNETERTASVTYSTNSYLTGDNYAGLSGKVTIPASITYGGKSYQVTGIGYRAFFYVTGITEVQLPEGLKSIGTNAFYNCPKLAKANIPSTVTEIGSSPFYGTPVINNAAGNIIYMDKCVIGSKSDNLSGALTVADGTRVIAGMAFGMCNGVTSLSLPSSVVSIGENAFQGCTAMTKADLSKCAKMTSIPNGAFTNCKALTSILLPSGIREIGSYAFYSIGATQFYVPDNVVSIGENAFLSSKLQTLSMPSSVEKIGQEAFRNSASLSAITLRGNNTTVIPVGANAFTGTAAASGKLTVPSGTKSAYSAANQWKTFGTIAEAYPNVNGLYYELNEDQQTAALAPDQSKEQNAQAARSSVRGASLTDNGNDVGTDMSEYNQSIPSLVIPSQIYFEGKNYTVTSVLPEAFSSCSSLSTLVFSQKTASVGNNAFDGTSIERIELPENLTTLSSGTFANCADLKKIRCRSAVPINLSGIDAFSGLIPSDITLRVPYGSRAAYESAPGWKEFNIEEESPCIGGLYYILNHNDMTATVSPETDDETNYRLLYGTVTIPASITLEGETYQVTGIEPKAFAHLSRVEKLIVRHEEPFDISGLNVFEDVEIGDITLLVPYNGMEKYPTADIWQNFMVIEPYEVQLTVEPQDPSLGTCTGSGIYEKNDSALIEAIPAEGYCFAGWDDGTLRNPTKWKLNETDEFVTAMFEPKWCIARFLDWDGTLLLATSVRYGDFVETADIPTVREGWHFTGWDENPTQIFDDTDFHAQYDPDLFDVTVAADNGSVVSTDIDGENIELTDIPYGTVLFLQAIADQDYIFKQWENADKRALRILTVNSDMDLIATFGPYEAIRGDVNGDGVVNGTDIQVIINLIVDGEYDELADINKDGVINGTDIQEVINIIVDGQ